MGSLLNLTWENIKTGKKLLTWKQIEQQAKTSTIEELFSRANFDGHWTMGPMPDINLLRTEAELRMWPPSPGRHHQQDPYTLRDTIPTDYTEYQHTHVNRPADHTGLEAAEDQYFMDRIRAGLQIDMEAPAGHIGPTGATGTTATNHTWAFSSETLNDIRTDAANTEIPGATMNIRDLAEISRAVRYDVADDWNVTENWRLG